MTTQITFLGKKTRIIAHRKCETGKVKPEIRNKQMRTLENETGIAKPELRNKKCEPGKTNEIAKPEIRNKKCETGKMELELRNKKCETEKKNGIAKPEIRKQEMRMAANFLEWNY